MQVKADGQVIGCQRNGIEHREVTLAVFGRHDGAFGVAFADRESITPQLPAAAFEGGAIGGVDHRQPAKTTHALIADHWSGEVPESRPVDRLDAVEQALQRRQIVQLIENAPADEVGAGAGRLLKALHKPFLGGVGQ
ncbi:MAG: hypothetical protein AW11_00164 [Candidatus Accumulibacter regalis]|uniref:Uncharacterized protein n=1 Tax=Accumulibacter regalis TaxID=522306 RepID=A0A011P8R2_ACCRE|nr:MAG: hypothetical protein AW11_00164 [Candidatus Accumulibacter regalis]